MGGVAPQITNRDLVGPELVVRERVGWLTTADVAMKQTASGGWH